MIGRLRLEGEHVPDLRVFVARPLHYAQCVGVGSRLRIVLHAGQEHWLHFGGFFVGVAHVVLSGFV